MSTPASAAPLRIAVMGAGAVGNYYGGMLARAGHRVTLIGRPAHVEAVMREGLRLETLRFDERVPMAASTDPSAVAGADAVLFCVKSTDTEAAADAIAPHLAPEAVVFTLQNGVDNADRLRARLANPVAATVVYVGCGMAGPGHVRHHGRGELVIEPSPLSERLARAFNGAAVPTQIDADVRAALWVKLVINCAYNALSAITQSPYGALVASPGIPEAMREVVAECRAVAAAEGLALPADLDATVAALGRSMAGQRSSTAQDLARGKPTEIEHLNGHVVRRGLMHGVPTPVNGLLLALVRHLEQRPTGG